MRHFPTHSTSDTGFICARAIARGDCPRNHAWHALPETSLFGSVYVIHGAHNTVVGTATDLTGALELASELALIGGGRCPTTHLVITQWVGSSTFGTWHVYGD